jgi:hypothetical protein
MRAQCPDPASWQRRLRQRLLQLKPRSSHYAPRRESVGQRRAARQHGHRVPGPCAAMAEISAPARPSVTKASHTGSGWLGPGEKVVPPANHPWREAVRAVEKRERRMSARATAASLALSSAAIAVAALITASVFQVAIHAVWARARLPLTAVASK